MNVLRRLCHHWRIYRHECMWCSRSATLRIVTRYSLSDMKHKIFACANHANHAGIHAAELINGEV